MVLKLIVNFITTTNINKSFHRVILRNPSGLFSDVVFFFFFFFLNWVNLDKLFSSSKQQNGGKYSI